jgi:hypothetical protein
LLAMPWPSATDIGLDSLPPSATLDLYPPDAYKIGVKIGVAIAYQVFILGLSFDNVCLLMSFIHNLRLRKSRDD